MPATGPITGDGKAASSRNAVKHGILSESPLVTPQETADGWEAHLTAVRENLAPRDHLETCLAERVALLLWRMRRLACAEVEAITWSQDRCINDYPKEEFNGSNPMPVLEYVKLFRKAEKLRDLWTSVWETPEGDWLDNSTAVDLLKQAISLGGGTCEHAPPGLRPYGDWSKEVWTAGRLRTCLDWIVTHRSLDAEKFRSRCLAYFEDRVKKTEAAIEEVEQDLERMARRRMLPPEEEIQRQTRYEAHLGRELSRTMKSLRDLQSRPLELGQSTISTLQSSISNGGHREDRPLNGSTPFQPEAENYETNSASAQESSVTPLLHHSTCPDVLGNTPAGQTQTAGHEEDFIAASPENCETNPAPMPVPGETPLLHHPTCPDILGNTPADLPPALEQADALPGPDAENCETNPAPAMVPSETPLIQHSTCPDVLGITPTELSVDLHKEPAIQHRAENCETNSPPVHDPSGTPILQHSITPAVADPASSNGPVAAPNAENCETNPFRKLTPEELDASFYPPPPTPEEWAKMDRQQVINLGGQRERIYQENKRRYEESLALTQGGPS